MTLDEAIAEIEDQLKGLDKQHRELQQADMPTFAAAAGGGAEVLKWVLQLLGQVKTAPPQNWDLP